MNNWITIDGIIINIDDVREISSIKQTNKEFYFEIFYKCDNAMTVINFNYTDCSITIDNKNEFLTKLENEWKKLETYLLEGNGNSKRFFVKIDLKK